MVHLLTAECGTSLPCRLAAWYVREWCYIDRAEAVRLPGKDDPNRPSTPGVEDSEADP
jgi:hypothetical protein